LQVEESDESLTVLGVGSLTSAERYGQGAEKHATRRLFVGNGWLSGGLLFGPSLLFPLGVLKVTTPSGGMEDGHGAGSARTLGLEDPGQLFIIVGHHSRLGGLLGGWDDEEAVDVLNGSESLLPQLELDGGLELSESSVQMAGQRLDV
jgi:hypothetical protein